MHTNLVGLDKSFYTILSESFGNKKNSGYSLLSLDLEISTKTHLLELSTVIHVVRNQIKCILVNERPRDISLARLRDLICRVYQSVNDVSVCC